MPLPLPRRDFLKLSAGALAAWPAFARAQEAKPKVKVAAVVTEYRENSHADVIVGKLLAGYDQKGGPGPQLEVVSLFCDQYPASDVSRKLAEQYGFKLCGTIAEALTLGTDKLAVGGVVSIGEHGNYPAVKETGQVTYPRRRFFDGIVDVYKKTGQVAPIFNDKHLAWNWADAHHMYTTARELQIPFLAGSSAPVAWRKPQTTWPLGSPMTGALGIGYGPLEGYGFHALECLQCQVERRQGGETGVVAVQAVSGDAILEAEKAGRWSRKLLTAGAKIAQAKPKDLPATLRKDAVLYLIEYKDGFQAALAMNTGWSDEFSSACAHGDDVSAIWYTLEEEKPFRHFAHLVKAIEHTFVTGKPAYPVERTLLVTGMLDALMHSHAEGGRRIETPHLDIAYTPADWPFAKGDVPAV